VQSAIQHVMEVAKARGKPVGVLSQAEADCRRYLDLGMTVVAVGMDVVLLRNASRDLCQRFKPDAR
jgi:2-dehydro-3-deoxyglucarate aldolase